jgi:uncharacterized protein with PIN domain
MSSIVLYFFGELKDFFSTDNLEQGISYSLERKASVKDVIESLGPPHTEIGSIEASGRQVDFGYIVRSGDEIRAHPFALPIDVHTPSTLRPEPLDDLRFVVDVNVGRLAMLLRLLGLDTAYQWTWRDADIAEVAARERRIVLTRDKGLLKRSKVTWGRRLRAEDPDEQLLETARVFGLTPPFNLMSRCLRCNTPLEPVDKQDILHRLEPKTKKFFHSFSICPDCQRIYWSGSHFQQMQARLERLGLLSQAEDEAGGR